MITTADLLHLLMDGYHDGRYLNGHPNIVQHLMYDVEHTDNDYYIQLIDGPSHARIWSSRHAYEESLRRRIDVLGTSRNAVDRGNNTAPSPLIDEIRRAIEQQNFMRIIELKQMARDAGIDIHKQFNMRDILKKGK